VIQAWLLKNRNIDLTYCEQVVYRSIKCSECVKEGKCKHCGCAMPAATLSPDNFCSEGKWGPMMDTKGWNRFKELHQIDFKL
jgi:hypothetical protein